MPITPKSIKPQEIETSEQTKKMMPEFLKKYGADSLLQDTSTSNFKDIEYNPEALENQGIRIKAKRTKGNLTTYRVEINHDNQWKVLGNLTYDGNNHSISGPISAKDPIQAAKIKELVGKHHEYEQSKAPQWQEQEPQEENVEDLGNLIYMLCSGQHDLQKANFNYYPLGVSTAGVEMKPKPVQKKSYDPFDYEFDPGNPNPKRIVNPKPIENPTINIGGVAGNQYGITIKKNDGSFSQHKLSEIRSVLSDPNHPNYVSIKNSTLSGNVLKTPEGHEIRIHHPDLLKKIQISLGRTK